MSAIQKFLAATSATLPRQCATAAVLFASGDIIAQQVIEKRGLAGHDVLRTGRIVAYGGGIFAPLMSQWFKVLNKIEYKSKITTVAARVGIDQTIAAPNLTALFFSVMTLLEGKSFSDINEKLQTSWWPTLTTGWTVFIPVQAVNMAFVPPQNRLLFINAVNLCWNTYLSYVANAGMDKEVYAETRMTDAHATPEA